MSDAASGDASNSQTQTTQVEQSNIEENVNSQQPNLGHIRKAGQKEVLDVLAKVTGQQFSSTKDAASYVESLLKTNTNVGDVQPEKKTGTGNKTSSEMAELRQMIQNLQSTIAEKDQVVRKTSLQAQIKDVAVKAGFDPNYLDIATQLFESQIGYDDDGSYYIKGKDSSVRLDQNGEPLTLDKLAGEILRNRPKLAVEQPRTGTGTKFGFSQTRAGGDMPDAAADPEGWKAWKQANGVGVKGTKSIGVNFSKRTL